MLCVGVIFRDSEEVGVMLVDELDGDRVLVSHSNDHFVLSVREARELRDQLTRQLREVLAQEFSEEDG